MSARTSASASPGADDLEHRPGIRSAELGEGPDAQLEPLDGIEASGEKDPESRAGLRARRRRRGQLLGVDAVHREEPQLGADSGERGLGLAVADEDGRGPLQAAPAEGSRPPEVLEGLPDHLLSPEAAPELGKKGRRGPVRAAERSPDEGHREVGADEARHPIVGEGDLMEDVEPVLPDEPPGHPEGFHLPEEIIEREAEVVLEQRRKCAGQGHIPAVRFETALLQSALQGVAVVGPGQDGDVVEPAELSDDVPAEDGLAGEGLLRRQRMTGVGRHQDPQPAHDLGLPAVICARISRTFRS